MIELFRNIEFQQPWVLLALMIIPIGIAWYLRNRQKYHGHLVLPAAHEIPGLNNWRSAISPWLPALRVLSVAFLIFAFAQPQLVLKEEEIKAEGIDIMLVMDLSSSMLAQDFKPDRLEASKSVAAEFVEKRSYDRIGLAVFAGEAFTQCPLTTDHAMLKNFLADLECGLLEDGTAIGMGLASAVNRIKDSEAESKVIILLTDGVNNAGYIKPLTAAEIAEEYNIRVYTIGVGSTGDALTPVSRRSDGSYIFGFAKVEIDEKLLRQIAEMTNGRYFRATSEESLEQVYTEIDKLEKTEIEITTIRRYSEEFRTFLQYGLIFLLLEVILRRTVFRVIS